MTGFTINRKTLPTRYKITTNALPGHLDLRHMAVLAIWTAGDTETTPGRVLAIRKRNSLSICSQPLPRLAWQNHFWSETE